MRASDLALGGPSIGCEHLVRLEAAGEIDRGFPYDFINTEPAQHLPFGASWTQLAGHRGPRYGRAVTGAER